jgi:hypothetical protein
LGFSLLAPNDLDKKTDSKFWKPYPEGLVCTILCPFYEIVKNI